MATPTFALAWLWLRQGWGPAGLGKNAASRAQTRRGGCGGEASAQSLLRGQEEKTQRMYLQTSVPITNRRERVRRAATLA